MRLTAAHVAVISATMLSLGLASSAKADFIFSNTRTPITVGGQSYDRVTLYAFNNGTGYTAGGTKLLGLEITTTSSAAMRFQSANVDNNHDGLDISLSAPTATIAAGTSTYTKLIGELFTPFMFDAFPNNPLPDNISTDDYDPVAAYTNRTSFYALGVSLDGTLGVPANLGKGAAFAQIVTAPNATVSITGQIGGETGTVGPAGAARAAAAAASPTGIPMFPYAYTAAVPEPATLAAAALLAPLVRRRRSAR